MPIWKITDDGPVEVTETRLKQIDLLERHLEDWVVANHTLLGESLLVIGRQVMIPDFHDRIDVLALDTEGNAVVIELKRGKVKDPVDMQALRYASYISRWTFDDFEIQARNHLGKTGDASFNFNEIYEAFCAEAGVDEVPDLNTDQRIIIVGAEVKAKLGSVALWLLEHNVDIKVIEMEVYREGGTVFLQPRVIIPQPVSRFSDAGQPKPQEGARPWVKNGRSWHLEKRCSAETRKMLLTLNDLIRDNFEVDGPRWNQKSYVAYRVGRYNWLHIHTHTSLLGVDLLVPAGTFDQHTLAERLGVAEFDTEESLSDKLGLPSSVTVKPRNESTEEISLRIKEDFDLNDERFLAFLKDIYQAFLDLRGDI
jgi:hypothetical protein